MTAPEPPAVPVETVRQATDLYRECVRAGDDEYKAMADTLCAFGLVPDTGQARERLVPAVNLDGTEDDHDCTYRRMLRDVGEWLGVETDTQGRYNAQQIRSRVAAAAVPDTGQARELTPLARARQILAEPEVAAIVRAELAKRSAPDVAATALRDAARLLDMVADARDVYLEGMEEDSESAVAIETFGSGIRSAARVLRAEPHTVELLVPTWRYLGELAELDLRVRALLGTDTTPEDDGHEPEDTEVVSVPRVQLREWAGLLLNLATHSIEGLNAKDISRDTARRLAWWAERPSGDTVPAVAAAAPCPQHPPIPGHGDELIAVPIIDCPTCH